MNIKIMYQVSCAQKDDLCITSYLWLIMSNEII